MGSGTPAAVGFIVGGIILVASFALHFALPDILADKVKDDLKVLDPTSKFYHTFRNTSATVDVYESYYIYDILNVENVTKHGAAPVLELRGPYTYLLTKWRPEANISWRTDGTIHYTNLNSYHFQPALSNGTEADALTIPALGVLGLIKHGLTLPNASDKIDFFLALSIAFLTADIDSVFTTRPVKEILFGYMDPVMSHLKQLLSSKPADAKLIHPWVALVDHPENQTSGKTISAVYSGGKASPTQPQAPEGKANHMVMWTGYYKKLPFWGTDYANMINGTNGAGFSPGLKKGESIYAFVDTLFRSVLLHNNEQVELEGVPLSRYTLAEENLEPGSVNPDNKAFFIEYRGLQPVPPSSSDPVWFTKPFLLDTDRSIFNVTFTNEIQGEAARRAAYDTHLDVEPHTGQLCHVHKRMQINTKIGPIRFNNNTGSLINTLTLPDTYLPVLWADEHMRMPSHLLQKIKGDVLAPLEAANYGGWGGIGLGFLIAIIASFLLYRYCQSKPGDSDRYISDDKLLNSGV